MARNGRNQKTKQCIEIRALKKSKNRTASSGFSGQPDLIDLREEIDPHVWGLLRIGKGQVDVAARGLRHFFREFLFSADGIGKGKWRSLLL